MADVQPLFIDTDGLPTEMADTDSLDLGGLDMSGDITMNSNEVTGLPATPSGDTAAASKAYVDAIASGLHLKETARLATTAVLSTWIAAGSGVGKTLTSPDNNVSNNDFDGVTASLNDRILVKDGGPNATPAVDNGIYTVTQLANGTTLPTILTRATDFDTTAEAKAGSFLWVAEGSTQADTQWGVTTDDPITVDTTAINWTQMSGPGTYTGGDGIDITGSTITVDLATGAVIESGLQFGSGADAGKLAVDPGNGIQVTSSGVEAVAYNGITVDANGISVNAGDGLVANAGPGDLDIDLATGAVIQPGLQFGTGADAGKLAVLPDPAGALLVLAAGLHVNTDDTTIQINGSNQLEVIGAAQAEDLQEEVTANENVTAGDPVFWGGANDQVQESRAATAGRRKVVGVMEDTVTATNTGTMIKRGTCAGVLSSATVGDRYYLAAAGGLTAANTPPTGSGDAVIFIGHARNADDLDVLIQYIGRRA